MQAEEARNQLLVVRRMVEKAQRETAQSGHFFIWLGVVALATVIAMDRLEALGTGRLAPTVLAVATVACGVIGYLIVTRSFARPGARSYAESVCYGIWFACGVSAVIAVLLLPSLGAYSWSLAPVLASLFMGVGLMSSGIVLETPILAWCSMAWWAGAVAMAFLEGTPKAVVMMAAIALGWILPGVVLNRTRARVRGEDEA